MKISELIKQLTDNLTDEQKAMTVWMHDSSGEHFEIDAIVIVATSANSELPEGQPILCCFGTTTEE